MKGLLLKDFYIIRESLLILFVTFIAVGAGMAVIISPWVLVVVAATALSTMAVTTIQNDKSTQWNRFSATLPVSREQIISSKYFMYVLLCSSGIVLGTIVSAIASLWKQSFDIRSFLMFSCLAVIISMSAGSVSIPFAFLFDEEKGMVGMILAFTAASGLFAGLVILLNQFIDLKTNMLTVCGIAAFVSVVLFLLSWRICPKKLSQKDI